MSDKHALIRVTHALRVMKNKNEARVGVCFEGDTTKVWVPSMLELLHIIEQICQLEDIKYPPPAQGGEFFLNMIREMRDNPAMDKAVLVKKYGLQHYNVNTQV